MQANATLKFICRIQRLSKVFTLFFLNINVFNPHVSFKQFSMLLNRNDANKQQEVN